MQGAMKSSQESKIKKPAPRSESKEVVELTLKLRVRESEIKRVEQRHRGLRACSAVRELVSQEVKLGARG
jgi:hypothetical protein